MDKTYNVTYLALVDEPTESEKLAISMRLKERKELIKLRDKLGIPKLK